MTGERLPSGRSVLAALAVLWMTTPLPAADPPQAADGAMDAQSIAPRFEGEPAWVSIAGTPLSYAANTTTPLIRIDSHTYYALENAVWFAATAPRGPWVIAASVPAILYSIPPDSPLYHVTFVRGSGSPAAGFGCRPAVLGAYVDQDTRVYSTATGCPNQTWASGYLPAESYGYGYGYGAAYAPWGPRYWGSRDRVDHRGPAHPPAPGGPGNGGGHRR